MIKRFGSRFHRYPDLKVGEYVVVQDRTVAYKTVEEAKDSIKKQHKDFVGIKYLVCKVVGVGQTKEQEPLFSWTE